MMKKFKPFQSFKRFAPFKPFRSFKNSLPFLPRGRGGGSRWGFNG